MTPSNMVDNTIDERCGRHQYGAFLSSLSILICIYCLKRIEKLCHWNQPSKLWLLQSNENFFLYVIYFISLIFWICHIH